MTDVYIDSLKISFSITNNGVHIVNDNELHLLMDINPVEGIEELVYQLKKAFESTNKRNLKISEKSLALEIWGHYWFERLYLFMPLPFRWLQIENRIKKSMVEFDCAEHPIDNNRIIWDFLSLFYPFFRFVGKTLHYN